MTLVLALFWIAIAVALLQSFRIIQLKRENRFLMSRTAELTQAVTDLSAAVQNVSSHLGNQTPDADVDTAITGINAAKDALNTLAGPPTP